MTLLISVFAAVISTAIWYRKESADEMKVGLLCWLFWGSSIMWLVDAIYEYIELGAEYFSPEPKDMLNDIFLGLSVVALGMVIWIIVLLVSDPKGRVRKALFNRRSNSSTATKRISHTKES